MSKSILEEAIEDAKILKATAIENAKNTLVEALAPNVKQFVESQLGETTQVEVGLPGQATENAMYEDDSEEGGDALGVSDENDPDKAVQDLLDQGLSVEDLMDALKKLSDEQSGGDVGLALGDVSVAGVGESVTVEGEKQEEDEKMKNESEIVEMTQQDVKTAFSEALEDVMKDLKTEATVASGFADVKKVEDGGLMDKKQGEQPWNDAEAPAAKDWTVKEAAYKEKLKTLHNANVALKTENTEYKKACDFLKRNLQEVNLFNSKLMYTNKLFQSVDLNHKQRVGIIEQFDNAQSMREVELIYKSLSESLKIAGVVNESKDPKKTFKGAKASRFAAPSSTVLKESLEKEESSQASRWETLAGLIE